MKLVLDVNALLAWGLDAHPHHDRTRRWLARLRGGDRLPARVQTPAQTTDGHLLALAAKHGAELAALDPGPPGPLLIG